MAKRQSKNKPAPQINQTITQSVSIGQTWDSSAFAKLLQEQAKSNETAIKSLESAMATAGANQQQLSEQIAQSSMMKDMRDVIVAQFNDTKTKQLKEDALKLKEQEKLRIKQSNDALKENIALRKEEAKAITNIAKGMETFKTMGDRLSETSKKLKDNFGSMSALKTTALKAFNIGGIFNKSIAKEKFIQTQRKLGSEDDRSTLKNKFESANRAAKDIKKNESELAQFKKETGMSEADLSKTKEGKRLLGNREKLSEEYAKHDLKASLVRRDDKPEMTALKASDIKKTPTQVFADSGANEEAQLEQNKMVGDQTSLLSKIEENTRGASPDQKAKPAEGEGGQGLMSGLLGGGKAGKALEGMKNFGIGLIAIAGALWIASEAFKNFGQVAWEDVGKGLVALGGIVVAAIALDKVKGSILKGAMVLGVLGLAVYGMGEAFKSFAELDWETIGKGMAAIVGLGVIAAVMGTFIGPVALGAVALLALGAALWVVGEAMQAVGQGFKDLTDGIERLANLDGGNLLAVAAGVGALGLAMAAFGAGQAAAGLGNLVSRFLTIGTDSPIEQLIKIGNAGEGVEKAGKGMTWLSQGMVGFNKVEAKSLENLNKFPWEKATKFVAAGGVMSVDGSKVYNQSKGNADEGAKVDKSGGNKTNVVNAPVSTTSNNTNVYASSIRNQESSQSRYINRRFAGS